MSKPRKHRTRSRTRPLYTEGEVKASKSGAKFVPFLKTQLSVAIREDMEQVLESLSEHSMSFNNMDWLAGGGELGEIQNRIARALEFLHFDMEEDGEDGENSRIESFEYGKKLILDLAFERLGGSRNADEDVLACMIALIAMGRTQNAFDLAKFAGSLKCVTPLDGSVHYSPVASAYDKDPEGVAGDRATSRLRDQYDILRTLKDMVDRDEVPTKRALCAETFGVRKGLGASVGQPRVEAPDFSKRLKGLRIANLVPDEPRGRRTKVLGTIHKFDLRCDGTPHHPSPQSRERSDSGEDVVIWDEPLSPDHQPQSSKSNYFHRDLTRIKEAFGLVYHALLLKFQMAEPKTPEELDRFVGKLSQMGLELGWARKRKVAFKTPGGTDR